jgi:pimeloyl-ACP methyl ester carboxylesterase
MCGQVRVPEDRAVKGGRQIDLNIVVLPARSAAGHADPVFGIAGGPGIASTRLAASYPRLYDGLQADHDIVLVDQRGTGDSHPLVCTAFDLTKTPARAFDESPDAKTLMQCRDRLAVDTDVRQYTTSAAVEDLEAVRQTLAYTKINLLGISYGTRVGLEYLRRHGAQVRAIALSGVIAPDVKSGLNGARDSQQALKKVFDLCASDQACSLAFPKLALEFDSVLAALDKMPATASLPTSEKGPPLKVAISRRVFARELVQLLHSREDVMALPLAIHHAAANDYMPFAVLAFQRQATRNPQADGMALSVLCAQDVPSFTAATIAASARGSFLHDDRAQYLKRACTIWPHAVPDAAASTAVRSPVPALLISGALDPVTPAQYAADVAKTLPNGVHVSVVNVSHVPANPCVNGMIVAFLKSGSAKGLETGCAANIPPIKFVTTMP